jgi:hypothetical protein
LAFGWRGRRREIAHAWDIVGDHLVGENEYGSTAESFDRYFLPVAMAARGTRQPPPYPAASRTMRRSTRAVADRRYAAVERRPSRG